MKEETPQQKKRVLVIGWGIVIMVFLAVIAAGVAAIWHAGDKPSEPQQSNTTGEKL